MSVEALYDTGWIVKVPRGEMDLATCDYTEGGAWRSAAYLHGCLSKDPAETIRKLVDRGYSCVRVRIEEVKEGE